MKEPRRVLFFSQEIYPFLEGQTPIRMMNRRLPQACQEQGFETRTFMPKFGEVNERKNQVHDVIRLSGINLSILDVDHPLLLKVASIQSARIQIYFTDNDDLFRKRKGVADDKGVEYADNADRSIFYVRATMETIKKLSWTPAVVICSGWMNAVAPLYVKRGFADTPFFANTKVIVALDDMPFHTPFEANFARKMLCNEITTKDVEQILDKEVTYQDLMKFAIDYADYVVVYSDNADPELIAYAEEKGKLTHREPKEPKQYVTWLKGIIG